MMFAIHNRKRYRLVEENGAGVMLEPYDEDGPTNFVSYGDELLLLDPTDSEWEVAAEHQFHHQDDWGRDLCCQTRMHET